MSDEKPSCAHSRVVSVYPHTGMWECDGCHMSFAPITTAADLSRLTLGELEATAERLGKAVATIREAQGLLSAPAKATRTVRPEVQLPDDDEGPPPPRPEVAPDAVAAHRARQFQPVDADVPRELMRPKPERPRFSVAEQQQRAGLVGQFAGRAAVDPNLPEDMQAMEQGEPPR